MQIKAPKSYIPPDVTDLDTSLALLQQDDQDRVVQLVDAETTKGFGGGVTLIDSAGQPITQETVFPLSQNGEALGSAIYDYCLTKMEPGLTTASGLSLNYSLDRLEIASGKQFELAPRSGATGVHADLSASISGGGGPEVKAGEGGAVSLSSALQLNADNALDQTNPLNVAAGARVDLNGTTQSVPFLNVEKGGDLVFSKGVLSLQGGHSLGSLEGLGTLLMSGGQLLVEGRNPALSAQVSIAPGAAIQLNHVEGLGRSTVEIAGGQTRAAGQLRLGSGVSGHFSNSLRGEGDVFLEGRSVVNLSDENREFKGVFHVGSESQLVVWHERALGAASIVQDGTLILDHRPEWVLKNSVSGHGTFVKRGEGRLIVNGGELLHTGGTFLQGGTLMVGGAPQSAEGKSSEVLSSFVPVPARLGGYGAGAVTVQDGAILSGTGVVLGDAVNAGILAARNAVQGLDAEMASTLTLQGALTNKNLVNLKGGVRGNRLLVKGNYAGVGGVARLGVGLPVGESGSAEAPAFASKGVPALQVDRLLIEGKAEGTTLLVVDLYGSGGSTDTNKNFVKDSNEGVSLVQVAGASNASAFKLRSDYVVVGPWQYQLYAYAPGQSDAAERLVLGTGSDYWDYRLQSVSTALPVVSDGGSVGDGWGLRHGSSINGAAVKGNSGSGNGAVPTRLKVVPQVPAYLSVPAAMFGAGRFSLSGLHERLSDFRQRSLASASQEGGEAVQVTGGATPSEFFLRYIKEMDLHYNSPLSFAQYGYDFDGSYQGMQIGGNLLRRDLKGASSIRGGIAFTAGTVKAQPRADGDGNSRLSLEQRSFAGTLTYKSAKGAYLDAILAYDRYHGSVQTDAFKVGVASPSAQGWTGSLEVGAPLTLRMQEVDGLKIEPHFQLAYQWLSFGSLQDQDGCAFDENLV